MRPHGTVGRRLALALALAAAVLAACGGSGHGGRTVSHACGGHAWLTVYSDLPLGGAQRFDMYAVQHGELLALRQAHKRAGPCHVQLKTYDDASPASHAWDPGVTNQVAHEATADPSAIAYIGDFDSGATATSLQVTNAASTLQISPWSPYVGFTDSGPADDEGDPGRFQSSGHNTFARLIPSDSNQAVATASFMAFKGVRRLLVLGDVSDPFDADIAQLLVNDVHDAGVQLVGYDAGLNLETNTKPAGYAPYAQQARTARADAIFLAGRSGPGALALFAELHAVLPHARLFAPSTMATPSFLAALGPVAPSVFVASPILGWWQYPPAARRLRRPYRRMFHTWMSKYALYGYAAMADVLAAIGRADFATSPTALQEAFFHHLGRQDGPIGRYTIYPDGNSSLRQLDGYAVSRAGRLRFLTAIPVG